MNIVSLLVCLVALSLGCSDAGSSDAAGGSTSAGGTGGSADASGAGGGTGGACSSRESCAGATNALATFCQGSTGSVPELACASLWCGMACVPDADSDGASGSICDGGGACVARPEPLEMQEAPDPCAKPPESGVPFLPERHPDCAAGVACATPCDPCAGQPASCTMAPSVSFQCTVMGQCIPLRPSAQ